MPSWQGPPRRPRVDVHREYADTSRPELARATQHHGIAGSTGVTVDQNILRYAQLSTEAPRVPWDVFVHRTFVWGNGQHVALIGPTGQGKTTMLMNILPFHPYVTMFATKPRDETMDTLLKAGYVKMEHWRSIPADQYPRRVLWPDARKLDSRKVQRDVFHDAFERIYLEGGWTVAIDELWYIINILKLDEEIRLYLLQARALGISLVCATQRPAFVPLEVYDQSTHLMFWRDNDENNLKRLSGISWRSAGLIRNIVSELEPHQILYVNTRTGQMARTRCPKTLAYGEEGQK